MMDYYKKNTQNENYVLFLTSEFSQWYPSTFICKDGNTYHYAEQYMMYQKAMLFGDSGVALKILQAETPDQQKELGRAVANFDLDIWHAHARDIVYQGNYYKFTQNPHLYEVLAATEGKQLVEAAHYDPVWGIGLKADDPLAADPANWQGKNWLGGALTKLRDDLKAQGFTPVYTPQNYPLLRFYDDKGQRMLYVPFKSFIAACGWTSATDYARDILRQHSESQSSEAGQKSHDILAKINKDVCVSNTVSQFVALNAEVLDNALRDQPTLPGAIVRKLPHAL